MYSISVGIFDWLSLPFRIMMLSYYGSALGFYSVSLNFSLLYLLAGISTTLCWLIVFDKRISIVGGLALLLFICSVIPYNNKTKPLGVTVYGLTLDKPLTLSGKTKKDYLNQELTTLVAYINKIDSITFDKNTYTYVVLPGSAVNETDNLPGAYQLLYGLAKRKSIGIILTNHSTVPPNDAQRYAVSFFNKNNPPQLFHKLHLLPMPGGSFTSPFLMSQERYKLSRAVFSTPVNMGVSICFEACLSHLQHNFKGVKLMINTGSHVDARGAYISNWSKEQAIRTSIELNAPVVTVHKNGWMGVVYLNNTLIEHPYANSEGWRAFSAKL